MALSGFTTNVKKASRTYELPHGLKFAHVQFVVGATGDYSAGFDVDTAIKRAAGFSTIITVFDATLHTSNFTITRGTVSFYDRSTGKLRFWVTGAALNGGFAELAAGNFAANDVVDCCVIGIQ